MNNREWLENLKPGDKVVVHRGWRASSVVREVTRVTKTQIVVGADRYLKRNGGLMGGSGYSGVVLLEATPERVAEVEAASRRRADEMAIHGFLDRMHERSDEHVQKVADAVRSLTD